MKLFVKASIAAIALLPLTQSCRRLSPAADAVSGNKTKLVKDRRTYKGWNSMCLTNAFVELHIVPQIGGRIRVLLGESSIGREIAADYGP